MKKVFTIFSIVLLALSFAHFSHASVDSIYEVAIVNMKGDVQVDTNGDGIWIKPWIGMKLMEAALIKTGNNSSVDIVFDAEGLNLARIEENTLTTVRKALLELPDGKIFADFANLLPGSSFTIKTPTAACSIRGSAMAAGVVDGVTTAWAYRDNVYVQGLGANGQPQGSSSTLPQGNRAGIGQGGRMGNMEGMSEADMNAFREFESGIFTGGTGTGTEEPEDVVDAVDTKDLDEVRDISPSN